MVVGGTIVTVAGVVGVLVGTGSDVAVDKGVDVCVGCICVGFGVSTTFADDMSDTYFEITDQNSVFVQCGSGPAQEISLSDTIYNGVFKKLITDNIITAFMEVKFAAIVMFAIFVITVRND